MNLLNRLRQWKASQALDADRTRRLASPEHQQWLKRRDAALRGIGRRKSRQRSVA